MEQEKYPAHLRARGEEAEEQSVEEHCRHVAEYASRILSDICLGSAGMLTGLVHDMGKAKQAFREYLWKAFRGEKVARGSVMHSFAGVRYLLERYHGESADELTSMASEILACASGMHHALFDCVDGRHVFALEDRLTREDADCGTAERYFHSFCPAQEADARMKEASEEIGRAIDKINDLCVESDELGFGEFCFYCWRVLDAESSEGSNSACWLDTSLMKAFISYYGHQREEASKGLCMITGREGVLAEQHVKGVIASSGNAKLISANDTNNFT